MPDTIRQFKKVMSLFPTGVTVVTARCNGDVAGLTVNSFTSVSLDPLLVLISITRNTTSHEILSNAGSFTVSFLSEDQEMASMVFAGAPHAQRFARVETALSPAGNPYITGACAFLDAEIVRAHDEGDHTLFIGRVTCMRILDGTARPLLYHRGRYARLRARD